MASMDAGLPPPELPRDENNRTVLQAVWWTQLAIATIFIVLRIWARTIKRTVGLDDVAMIGSWVLYLADAIIIHYLGATDRLRHLMHIAMEGGLAAVSSTLMWLIIVLDIGIFLTGLGKIAIGLTILRIIGDTSEWQRWAVKGTLFLTIATCIIDACISTFRCGDPRITWTIELHATAKNCVSVDNQTHINIFANTVQVFADFAFSILPMAVVWNLRLPKHKKQFLVMALGLTLVTGAAGAVKTYYAAKMDKSDISFTIMPALVWFSTESMLILVCGSVPSLHPLWEKYIRKGTGESTIRVNVFGSSSRGTGSGATNPYRTWPGPMSTVSSYRNKPSSSTRNTEDWSLATLNDDCERATSRHSSSKGASEIEVVRLVPSPQAVASVVPRTQPQPYRPTSPPPDNGGIQVVQEVFVTSGNLNQPTGRRGVSHL
ncbi:hypothetical protein QBC35DRAFT_454550 [Podospora australis]|uniref:Rhodopsin domain-containing protein n=1 Tax=Podospora australis TaxID=1536484 RepID=A0AAN6WPJ8_9PEZI|nr:hypothetical protein QBC35DRAFT_454550 [Podospora australis]